jgi:hypothetical protein
MRRNVNGSAMDVMGAYKTQPVGDGSGRGREWPFGDWCR